jgi:hypothetical protein
MLPRERPIYVVAANLAQMTIDSAPHEIIDRAIERLSDEDLKTLGHLSDSEESSLPTEREGAVLHAFACAIERERGCLKPSPPRRYTG